MTADQSQHVDGLPDDRPPGADLSIRSLALVTGGLILLMAVAIVGANLLTPAKSDIEVERVPRDADRIGQPSDPRITQSHRVLRRKTEQSVNERLNTYGWIDPEAGIARIPIDRAVEIVLERGLPSRIAPDSGRTNVPPAGPDRRDEDERPADEGRSNEP